MKPLLAVETSEGLWLDFKVARKIGDSLAQTYCLAKPFPHIVIDDFLPLAVITTALKNFPEHSFASEVKFEMGYAGHHKRQILPEECNSAGLELFRFLNSKPILEFLEALTGIQGLIPDPHFIGGGFHETARGGKLGIHADFRINDRLHLHRRLNVIIYLNENWKEEYGGFLELWDRKMTMKCLAIAPIINRCVVFNTDADSYHGHPEPLNSPENVQRRSIALYYYTASREIYNEVPSTSTVYHARPIDDVMTRQEAFKLRMDVHISQWIPPALQRYMFAIKRRLLR